MTPPPPGSMYLFDYLTVPLKPDSYRMHYSTDLAFDKESHQLSDDRYFDVVGPRFNLASTEISATFPPVNGHGPFSEVLAQVAIMRRTLPWERPIDAGHPIGDPSDHKGLPDTYPTPWMALLLFEEGEYTLLQAQSLETVVGATIFSRLGSPQNILCDAVEADLSLVKSIMPSKEELQLLTHVRWVNIDDRELSAEGSSGYFAIVMTNRLASPGAKCRACLVSLEQRTDLVSADPPASSVPTAAPTVDNTGIVRDIGEQMEATTSILETRLIGQGAIHQIAPTSVRLVLLYSWPFTSDGDGTFYNLMQNLDVGMIGRVATPNQPAVIDTGHIAIQLDDRGGTQETALYRGPLVPMQLTRDPLGPYHSADQARRASPEAGVEDVSYAAAFETGRLLAAADARLAQELMRWRRESYKQAARLNTIGAVQKLIATQLPTAPEEMLATATSPYLAVAATGSMVAGSGPIADTYGLKAAAQTVGFNPAVLQAAWGLSTPAEAQQILGGDPGTLGVAVAASAQTARPNVTIDTVAADQASIARLNTARTQSLTNLKTRLGG